MKVPSTEAQNNFGKYLNIVMEGTEVIVTKNGKDAIKMVPVSQANYVREQATPYSSGEQKKITYKDFLELTANSDLRYELIDGELIQLYSPNYAHQVVVSEILVAFHSQLKGKPCRPITAPFDVTLFKSEDNINVVQPDIIIICDTENIDQDGRYKGIPSLVVEVLSQSTRRYDLLRKLDLYMVCGIKEYWIADPDKKEIIVYIFENQDIKDYATYKITDILKSKTIEGLEINLKEIFINY